MTYLSAGSHTIDIKVGVGGGGALSNVGTYYIFGGQTPLQIMIMS